MTALAVIRSVQFPSGVFPIGWAPGHDPYYSLYDRAGWYGVLAGSECIRGLRRPNTGSHILVSAVGSRFPGRRSVPAAAASNGNPPPVGTLPSL